VSEPLVFTLPLPVNLGNARFGHWSRSHRAKQEYWTTLDMMAMVRRIPPPPPTPMPVALMDVEIHHTHDCDRTNREMRVKWIEDWLTKRHYIVDDRDAHLKRTGEVRLVRCRRVMDRKLVLTLTEIAA
jgi:hypothetical protein